MDYMNGGKALLLAVAAIGGLAITSHAAGQEYGYHDVIRSGERKLEHTETIEELQARFSEVEALLAEKTAALEDAQKLTAERAREAAEAHHLAQRASDAKSTSLAQQLDAEREAAKRTKVMAEQLRAEMLAFEKEILERDVEIEQLRGLRELAQNHAAELGNLRSQRTAIEKEKLLSEQQVVALQTQLKTAESTASASQQRSQELEEDLVRAKDRLTEAETAIASFREKLAQHDGAAARHASVVATLQAQAAEGSTKTESLTQQCQALESQLEERKAREGSLATQLSKLKSENDAQAERQTNEVSVLQHKIAGLVSEHKANLEQLQEAHRSALTKATEQERESCKRDHATELEKRTAEQQGVLRRAKDELELMQKTHEENKSELVMRIERETEVVARLTEERDAAERQKATAAKEVEALQEEITQKVEQSDHEISRLRSEHESQLSNLRKQQEKELAEMRAEYELSRKTSKEAGEQELAALASEHQSVIRQLKSDHEEALAANDAKHTASFAAQARSLEDALSQHAAERNAAAQKVEAESTRSNDMHKAELESLMAQMEQLRSSAKEAGQRTAQLETVKAEQSRQLETLQGELANHKSVGEEAERRLTAELSSREEMKLEHAKQLAALRADVESREQTLVSAQKDLSTAQQAAAVHDQARKDLESQLSALVTELDTARARDVSSEAKLADLTKALAGSRKRETDLESRQRSVSEESRIAQQQLQAELQDSKEQHRRAVEDAKAVHERLTTSAVHHEALILSLRRQLEEHHSAAEQKMRSLSQELEQARTTPQLVKQTTPPSPAKSDMLQKKLDSIAETPAKQPATPPMSDPDDIDAIFDSIERTNRRASVLDDQRVALKEIPSKANSIVEDSASLAPSDHRRNSIASNIRRSASKIFRESSDESEETSRKGVRQLFRRSGIPTTA